MNSENNKLIAEFMGWEPGRYPNLSERLHTDIDGEEHGMDIAALKYHSSWEWLMPVVEKIETSSLRVPQKYRHGFMENTDTSVVSVDIFYDDRDEFKGWTWTLHFNAGNYITEHNGDRIDSKIEATYQAVVEFIKWYNTNILKNSQP